MNECKNCYGKMEAKNTLECPNCGAVICEECSKKTKRICPYCYSDLDFFV